MSIVLLLAIMLAIGAGAWAGLRVMDWLLLWWHGE